jgi:predicted nuclease with TOPRIM domain
MATTLFAIFGIALVAAMAWVITRIVNIFVELEELHQQARNTTERADNHCAKVNKMKEDVEHIKQTQVITAEHLGVIDEEIKELEQRCDALQICSEVVDEFDIVKLTSREEKEVRVAKYTELRANGLSIRKAGEEVGVSYTTAKRYERIRKEQSNETGNN